jgi:hypothetical protein
MRAVAPLQSTKTVSYSVGPAIVRSRRVSPVALVPPVVVVSLVVAVLAVLRAASPVLARCWFSFVHEGFSPAKWNQRGCADSEHLGSGMSRRNRVAKVGAWKCDPRFS